MSTHRLHEIGRPECVAEGCEPELPTHAERLHIDLDPEDAQRLRTFLLTAVRDGNPEPDADYGMVGRVARTIRLAQQAQQRAARPVQAGPSEHDLNEAWGV